MKPRKTALLVVLALFGAADLVAQSDSLWRGVLPRDTVIARVRTHVWALANDSMAGRRPTTKGNQLAATYIARAFDRLELDPIGRKSRSLTRYYQSFKYLHGVEAGKGNRAVISRGKGHQDLFLAPMADFTPMSFSSNGTASGPLVFAGYGIRDSAAGYDDYAGIDARGAIVLIMRYSPEGNAPHGTFAEKSAWTSKVRTAIAQGAKGIIFMNRPGDIEPMPEMTLMRGFTNVGIPCLFAIDGSLAPLRDPSGRTLTELRALIDTTRRPASFMFPGSKATITADVRRLETSIPNVVGLLPGNDPKLREEVIVIGAHFDHLGHGGEGSLHSGHGTTLHYGADDNASGTAGLLALAEEFARRRDNRRSILFIAFNAEESGLLGSQHFVRDVRLPKGLRSVAMINLDMIGRLDSLRLQVHGTGTSPVFEPILDSLNPGLVVKYAKEGLGPSDHASFYSKGVPVLAFFTGIHKDYHRPSDTPEKINVEGEATIVGYVRDVVMAIDRSDTPPPFTRADPPVSARSVAGFKVYVGTMPDYSFEGKGLRITGVSGGSPAEKAGLREGDIITKLGDHAIGNIYDYMDALSRFSPKQEVATEILRAGTPMTVTITMGSR